MTTDVVILAAGDGRRMGADIPKPLRRLHGQTFLERVVETVSRLPCIHQLYIVTNHRIRAQIEGTFPHAVLLLQQPEKGTAKAMQAYTEQVDDRRKASRVLVIPADIPMIPRESLELFLRRVPQGDGVIVFRPSKDGAYGRVISNCDGTVQIVEAKDCSHHHATVMLRNTGVYLLTQETLKSLPLITNENAQGEYYLTDIFETSNAHVRLHKIPSSENFKFYGVNTTEELSWLEHELAVHGMM